MTVLLVLIIFYGFTIKLTTPKVYFMYIYFISYSQSKIKRILRAYLAITYLNTKPSYTYRKEFCLCIKISLTLLNRSSQMFPI